MGLANVVALLKTRNLNWAIVQAATKPTPLPTRRHHRQQTLPMTATLYDAALSAQARAVGAKYRNCALPVGSQRRMRKNLGTVPTLVSRPQLQQHRRHNQGQAFAATRHWLMAARGRIWTAMVVTGIQPNRSRALVLDICLALKGIAPTRCAVRVVAARLLLVLVAAAQTKKVNQ